MRPSLLNTIRHRPIIYKTTTLTRPLLPYHIFRMSPQRAIVHESKDVAVLKTDVPLPKLTSDDWVLVKTKAVALNPTDWKNISKATSPGSIAGCDYAGIVEEVGKSVTGLKVGDRVAGFVRGGKHKQMLLHIQC
jgi:NADPH:quinone reductase-like Zn-dependent oxidoreductase